MPVAVSLETGIVPTVVNRPPTRPSGCGAARSGRSAAGLTTYMGIGICFVFVFRLRSIFSSRIKRYGEDLALPHYTNKTIYFLSAKV